MATSSGQLPPSFAKYFKTTVKAQQLMDPEGRICELDRNSRERELVYTRHPAYKGVNDTVWDEMNWSQATLWDQAQRDPTMRVARKSLRDLNMKAGETFEIYTSDLFNERERRANVIVDDVVIDSLKLGFEQCKREWVYVVSKKLSIGRKSNSGSVNRFDKGG